MNITLINPSDKSVYVKFKRPKIKRLSLGLAYIAAFLEDNKHNITVIDAEATDMDIGAVVQTTIETNPKVVGVTTTTPLLHIVLNILRELKIHNPNIYTFIGGPHVSALPKETLVENKDFVDFVIFGEGENSSLEIVNSIENGTIFSKPIDGVGYIDKSGNIVIGSKRELEKNLDNFPFPARHLYNMNLYVDNTKFGTENYIMLVSSRGCIGQCTFCGSQTTWGRQVRFRSAQNVIDEIKYCTEQFGIYNFVFCDDTFTLQKKHTIDICKEIIKLPYKLKIFCSSRADTICEERLKWLKRAGCYCITFGIESGDDDIIKLMKKNITTETIKHAVAITKEAGIDVHGSFIIGNIGDTKETIEKTIKFASSLNLDQIQFTILVPLPGTECYDKAIEMGLIDSQFNDFESFYLYYSVPVNLTDVSDEALLEYQKQAYIQWRK